MSKVTRSPSYPSLSLPEAIERARMVWEKEHQHPADREVIAQALGYGGINGASASVISALNRYGLLENQGGQLRISGTAMDILLHRSGDPEYHRAISKAALTPALFRELYDTYQGNMPSDHNLRATLVKNGFNPRTLDAVLRSYRETMTFLEQEGGVSSRQGSDSEEDWEVEAKNSAHFDGDGKINAVAQRGIKVDSAITGSYDKELLFQLSEDCDVRVLFRGIATQEALDTFVDLLKLSKRAFPKDQQADASSMNDFEDSSDT